MRSVLKLFVAALAVVLISADDVLAWGPAVHVGLADTIWGQLGLLPAAVAAAIARNRTAFLYGSLAADVVFAKRLSRIKQFCHHWSTAFRVLDSAKDDRGRAFAYGYLSHLAADTVAHGKYVPHQIVVSNSRVNAGHLFWELRADAICDRETHALVKDVLHGDHRDLHALLAGHLKGTFLPYDLNRVLFHRMNVLTVKPAFRKGMDVWSRRSKYYLAPELLDGYRSECIDRIVSILTAGHRSALTKEDPNGTSAMMRLSVHRRDTKRLKRRGHGVSHRRTEVSRGLSPTGATSAAPISEPHYPNGHPAAGSGSLHL